MRKLKYDFVKTYIEENSRCKLLSDKFLGTKSNMMFLCNCGEKFETTFQSFKNGKKTCNECSNIERTKKNRKYDTNIIKEMLKNDTGNEYTLLSEYNGYMNKITLKHNTCGNVYEVTPDKFFGKCKRRCPKCMGGVKNTYEDLLKVVESRKEYTLISKEYVNCFTKVKMIHNVCGTEFEVRPADFKNGLNGCPYCKQSKGEKIIENYLIENNIDYKRQYTFEKCRCKRPLPFDFAILNNNLPVILIEFNGVQHYEPFRFESKDIEKNKLNIRIERDNIKKQFAKDNNIELVIIRYDQINEIKSILDNLIKQGNTEVNE